MVEYGVAKHAHVGEGESGDTHMVCCNQNGVLIAVIDGIGHGEGAAEVARTAAALLRNSADEPVISLVERCHEKLKGTRGVVLSVAFVSFEQKMMTWIGVGNVQGMLVRANANNGHMQEPLLLRAGVVGSRLPSLQASVLPVSQGDTVVFTTDGIQNDFSTSLSARENPQRAADRILNKFRKRKKGKLENFEEEYRSALCGYAAGGGELALGRAYELGRRALEEQVSVVELASLHHQVLIDLIRTSENEQRKEELLRSSAEFLSECVSPYEMAHRGFQDAVKALRQLNETLEEEIKRIAYAVHDEAGQLLVAVHLALAEVAMGMPEAQQEQFTRIKDLLNEVEKHLRRYSHELRPTILDDLGWVPAIRFLADGVSKRANLPIHIDATVSGRLPTASAQRPGIAPERAGTCRHARTRQRDRRNAADRIAPGPRN